MNAFEKITIATDFICLETIKPQNGTPACSEIVHIDQPFIDLANTKEVVNLTFIYFQVGYFQMVLAISI